MVINVSIAECSVCDARSKKKCICRKLLIETLKHALIKVVVIAKKQAGRTRKSKTEALFKCSSL